MNDLEQYTKDFLTTMLEDERKLAIGLHAAKNMTTHQIAIRIEAAYGQHGAENIARAILREFRV